LLLVTAQEDATIDVEDGIQFTPFNMHVEMEEGRFDADGTYIPNKAVGFWCWFACFCFLHGSSSSKLFELWILQCNFGCQIALEQFASQCKL